MKNWLVQPWGLLLAVLAAVLERVRWPPPGEAIESTLEAVDVEMLGEVRRPPLAEVIYWTAEAVEDEALEVLVGRSRQS